MRLTVQSFTLQSVRLRRVLDYIDVHLDEDIALSRLADLACLSPSQLERLYAKKIGETPMLTVRRLRLKRAYEQIRTGGASLMDVALAANYNSQAAFTRAFVRQFGHAPSRLPSFAPPLEAPPQLRLECLPAREVLTMAYGGKLRERWGEIHHLSGSLAVSGGKRWRAWTILDRDTPFSAGVEQRIETTHFIPAAGQPEVRGIDLVTHPGGLYAVYEAQVSQLPRQLCALAERIRNELGCQIAEGAFGGRIIMRELTVSSYTAATERRSALYIPVAPLAKLFHSQRKTRIAINP